MGTYLGSAARLALARLFVANVLNSVTFIILSDSIFFLASSGASAAYLTASEIFPMETRALAIAFFYAIGTAAGGIAGPLLFGKLIGTDERSLVAIVFVIGAVVMAIGGVTEILYGVAAERQSLESIAMPLTAEEAQDGGPDQEGGPGDERPSGRPGQNGRPSDRWLAAQGCREEAERARARAAEHRAEAYDVQADGDTPGTGDRHHVALTLARIDELRADELEQLALAHDELADAHDGDAPGAVYRAQAAEQRARMLSAQAAALSAENAEEGERHLHRAQAAEEHARAREQHALAEVAAQSAPSGPDQRGASDRRAQREIAQARAAMHRTWAELHEQRAAAHEAAADADTDARRRHEARAAELERLGLAAEERVQASEHRGAAEELHEERDAAVESRTESAEAERRDVEARLREERIQSRIERRLRLDRTGLRRLRPGPSTTIGSPWLGAMPPPMASERALDHEVDVIARALAEHGPTERRELARRIGARYWGPGRFGTALDTAVDEGRATRMTRRTYGPGDDDAAAGSDGGGHHG